MDIDIKWAINRIIYGGANPEDEVWQAMFERLGLELPLYFVTTTWHGDLDELKSSLHSLGTHHHLAYWVASEPPNLTPLLEAKLVCSQAHAAASWNTVLHHWRQSILELRDRQLDALEGIPENPSLHDEQQARLICQSMMGDTQADVETALRRHGQVVLALHNRQLNVYRNALLDSWQDLQREYLYDQKVSYLSMSFLQTLTSTANLTALLDSYIESALALHAIICKARQRDHHTRQWPAALHDAMAYIQQHFQSPISLRDIADHCGFSAEHMARLFKQHTDHTAVQHLTTCRLDWAAEQLEQTTTSVTDIAFSAGFGSVEHFVRQFKRHKGDSPKRYRLSRR